MRQHREIPTEHGKLVFATTSAFDPSVTVDVADIRRLKAEQSNTSIAVGSKLMLKLLRRLQPGTHPEIEVGRFLTEVAGFPHTPALLGTLEHVAEDGTRTALAVLQKFVPNQGDAWTLMLEGLRRDFERVVLAPESVQAGVKTLVDNLKASPVKAPGTVRIDYWVVTGTAGQSGALPAALNEVAAALKEVEHNDGPMNFTLVEKLSVSTLSNERGSVEGRDTRIDQFASVVDGDVVADLDIARLTVGQKLRTRVRIKPGVIAALGSAGMATHDSNATPATIYFIVRAAQVDGATP